MISTITFKKATLADKEIIFSWLAKTHVKKFWDNTQAHKEDILNAMQGRIKPSYYCEGKYSYWIACADNTPYALLMSIQETPHDAIGHLKLLHLSKTGHTYGVDFMIGNTQYLGKGYGARTLIEFIDFFKDSIDKKADTFLIDPKIDNHRAIHVYKKAGFTYIADFIMEGEVSGTGKPHALFIKKSTPHFQLSVTLAKKLIAMQFPEYAHLAVNEVEQQGHDNRTYRVGNDLLIRLPTAQPYALKVPKEQALLPALAHRLSVKIPTPIKMGAPCADYPYPFSIYNWIEGSSANLCHVTDKALQVIAQQLANFLNELRSIDDVEGPSPGQHNWWRGAAVDVYDADARKQIASLTDYIDSHAALNVWEQACATQWAHKPVWIHGDVAVGNLLISNNTLTGVIDFGGTAVGDPACDLVIAWTYLTGDARDIFMRETDLDADTWLRARAWALWKASFELCQIKNKNGPDAQAHKKIINTVISHSI